MTVGTPSNNAVMPKVSRISPVIGCMPTTARVRPRTPPIRPFIMLPVDRDAMIVTPNTARRKYSRVPIISESSDKTGARKRRTSALKRPPRHEA